MLVYLLKSALLLALLYGGFALLLSRETFHRFNRVALLSVLVASMVLPALQLTMNKPSFLSLTPNPSPVGEGNFEGVITIEDESSLFSTHSAPSLTGRAEGESSESISLDWKQILTLLYLVGVLASVGIFLVQLFRFWRETKGGTRTRDDEGNTVIIRGGNFSPYSFFHTIVISVSDYEHLREPILAHEQAHIRLGHSWDLLLLEAVKAVQWFNPFVYLLGRDLKAVHEYEADNAVLNLGIDAKTYQLLLVTKAVGNRLQTLGNNLSHHSLKKRIKMMHKNSSNRWLMTKAVVLPALMALAVVAFAKPKTMIDDQKDNPVKMADTRDGLLLTDGVKDNSDTRMLKAWIVPDDCKNPIVKKRGNGIIVTWLKGTWVQKDDGEFIEEHPVCQWPNLFLTKDCKIMLDGQELDINSLPDLPASALKKMEVHFSSSPKTVNLITKPVQIPADVKGNINPELTILLTGTPPKDSGAKTTIWTREGIYEGFSWKNYSICSWKWEIDDIGKHLEEVAIRKDHHVRVNVCKGVPQTHIDRLKNIMREKGVLKFDIVRQ